MIEFGTNFQTIMQSEKAKEKAKTVGIPTILATGIAFHVAKNSIDSVTLGSRIKTAGKAGLLTAAVMAIATANKDSLIGIGEKVKGFINRKSDKKEVQQQAEQVPQMEQAAAMQAMPVMQMPMPALQNNASTPAYKGVIDGQEPVATQTISNDEPEVTLETPAEESIQDAVNVAGPAEDAIQNAEPQSESASEDATTQSSLLEQYINNASQQMPFDVTKLGTTQG